jgi:hypothetical protein
MFWLMVGTMQQDEKSVSMYKYKMDPNIKITGINLDLFVSDDLVCDVKVTETIFYEI